MESSYAWQHWDRPDLVNEATVLWRDDSLRASGVQRCPGYTARWSLHTASQWVTRQLIIHVEGNGWARSLRLDRSEDGYWRDEVEQSGLPPQDLAAPGLVPGTDLSSALDCDLGLCPLTNTMPIRRLGLLESDVPRTSLVMAWIDMPSLQVIASDQYYGSIGPASVSYASGTRGVNVELEVDEQGVVIDYPQLAHRIHESCR